jgi:hypothetical protein
MKGANAALVYKAEFKGPLLGAFEVDDVRLVLARCAKIVQFRPHRAK